MLKRRISSLVIVLIISFLVTGCFPARESTVKRKLEEKYGIEVKIEKIEGGLITKLFSDYFTVYAKSITEPKVSFVAYFDSDYKDFSDNYSTKVNFSRLADKIKEDLQLDGDIYIYCSGLVDVYFDNSNMSVDEIVEEMESTHLSLETFIFYSIDPDDINENELDKKIKNLYSSYGNGTLKGDINIYSSKYGIAEEAKEYLEENDQMYYDFYSEMEMYLYKLYEVKDGITSEIELDDDY